MKLCQMIPQPMVVTRKTATGGTIAVLWTFTKSGQTYRPSTLKPSGGVLVYVTGQKVKYCISDIVYEKKKEDI